MPHSSQIRHINIQVHSCFLLKSLQWLQLENHIFNMVLKLYITDFHCALACPVLLLPLISGPHTGLHLVLFTSESLQMLVHLPGRLLPSPLPG